MTEIESRGSSVATSKTCLVCTKAGRAARFPCLLFYTTVYASFPVIIEECRVAGCNFKDVIAVSVTALRDTQAELTKARAAEARLRFHAKRNLTAGFLGMAATFIVTVVFVLAL
jgi:hypothetical protein